MATFDRQAILSINQRGGATAEAAASNTNAAQDPPCPIEGRSMPLREIPGFSDLVPEFGIVALEQRGYGNRQLLATAMAMIKRKKKSVTIPQIETAKDCMRYLLKHGPFAAGRLRIDARRIAKAAGIPPKTLYAHIGQTNGPDGHSQEAFRPATIGKGTPVRHSVKAAP